MQPQPTLPQKSSNSAVKIILIIVAVIVVCCVLLFCLAFLVPIILGPQIGNIFSRVTSGLNEPMNLIPPLVLPFQ